MSPFWKVNGKMPKETKRSSCNSCGLKKDWKGLQKLWPTWKLLSDKLQKRLRELKVSQRMKMNQYQQPWHAERKGKKPQNFIWIRWEQTFSLIYSNISKDLKGKLAIHQFADTQVRAGNKDQQKTKRYCTDCTIYYRSWTFFTAAYHKRKQLLQTEEDARNLPRSLLCCFSISNSVQQF